MNQNFIMIPNKENNTSKEINLEDIISNIIKETIKGTGKLNILIAGKTGAGKSTLINSIFRGNLTQTGSGRPITQKIEEISKPGHPLTIIDTKGLELKDYNEILEQLKNEIQKRKGSENSNQHIHVAWVCIQSTSDRVENAELELCKLLTENSIPTIIVVTKSKKNDPFVKIVYNLIPCAKSVIGVRSIEEYIEELDSSLPVMGLDDLIDATAKILPEAQARAYSNALSTTNKRALLEKKNRAEIEVNISSGFAATAALTPIPFSDAVVILPIQIAMLAKVGSTYGMELSTTTITTLLTGALGGSAATLVGRAVVSGFLKLAPGIGSVAGGVLASTTAATLTKLLGNAYIAALHEFCEANPGEKIEVQNIAKELKKRFKF